MSHELPAEEVLKVARLARLRLTDAEVALYSRQLGAILEYIDRLREVNTDGVEPLAHALERHNVFRTDEPSPSLPRETALGNAPHSDGRYFLVPPILDQA